MHVAGERRPVGVGHLPGRGGIGLQPHELELDERPRPLPRVVRAARRLLEHAGGVRDAAGLEQRGAERGQQLAVAAQGGRALQQPRARRGVAAQQRGLGGRREPLRRRLRERRVGLAERGAGGVRLGEVVAGGLVGRAGLGLEPARDRLVQLGAPAARQVAVGGLADQRVPEAERVAARQLGALRPDQLSLRERDEARRGRLGHELRVRVEAAPLHRGVLEQGPLAGVQPREPRRQHGLDAGGELARGGADGDELLEEQRVALGGLDDLLGRARGELAGCGDEPARVGLRERVEHEHLVAGLRPRRARLQQLRPGDADEQDRVVAREDGEVVDEVEQRRLRPVQVLQHDDQRALARCRLEQPAHGPERLLGLGEALRQPGRGQHLAGRPARRRAAS